MTLYDDIREARSLGQAVPPHLDTRAPENAVQVSDGMVVTDERCPTCAWPNVCAASRTCWHENKRLRTEPKRQVEIEGEAA